MGEPSTPCNLNDFFISSVKGTQNCLRNTVPFDVVAVVVQVAVSSSPVAVPFCQATKVEVTLTDPSVPFGEFITVVVFGERESSQFALEKISCGDVLRFNRLVALRIQHYQQWHYKHFSLSNIDPNAGWSKLGCFDRTTGTLQMMRNQPISFLAYLPATSLASWFLEMIDRIPLNLHPLPCTRRSLSEIEGTNGLHSNIVVRIVCLDHRQTNIRDILRIKRPFRFIPNSIVGFSIVEDISGTRMTLLDPGNRFVGRFRKAHSSRVLLSVTNVTSEHESGLHGRPVASSETLLCTTQTTSVKEHTVHSATSRSEYALNLDARVESQVCPSAVEVTFFVVSPIRDLVVLENNLDTLLGSDVTFKEIMGKFLEQQNPTPMFTLVHDGSTLNVAAVPSVIDTLCGDICQAVLEDQGAEPVLWRLGFDLFRALVSNQVLLKWTIAMHKDGALEAAQVVLPDI